jgi:hypothetical protein
MLEHSRRKRQCHARLRQQNKTQRLLPSKTRRLLTNKMLINKPLPQRNLPHPLLWHLHRHNRTRRQNQAIEAVKPVKYRIVPDCCNQ